MYLRKLYWSAAEVASSKEIEFEILIAPHPSIDGAHVPDAADLGGQLTPDERDEFLHNLRE